MYPTGYNLAMFITRSILDLVVRTKDECFAIAIGAKENEVIQLRQINTGLSEALRYERARADALVDRLLTRDAKVSAVAPHAIAAAVERDEVAVKALKEAFSGLAEVGEIPEAKEARAFDFAGGGSAVAR